MGGRGHGRVRKRATHATPSAGGPGATLESQTRFLEALVAHRCSIRKACTAANINRSTHYVWLNTDDTYPGRYQAARQVVLDDLEASLFERAEASDRLLVFTLENKFREIYGKQVKVDGAVPVHSLDPEKLKSLTDQELDTLIRLSKKVAVQQA